MSVDTTKVLVRAFTDFMYHEGIQAKSIEGNLNPFQDKGQKHIEYLTDSDTVIFALSKNAGVYLMSGIHSFQRAHKNDLSFDFAFSMPAKFWEKEKENKSYFSQVVANYYA